MEGFKQAQITHILVTKQKGAGLDGNWGRGEGWAYDNAREMPGSRL